MAPLRVLDGFGVPRACRCLCLLFFLNPLVGSFPLGSAHSARARLQGLFRPFGLDRSLRPRRGVRTIDPTCTTPMTPQRPVGPFLRASCGRSWPSRSLGAAPVVVAPHGGRGVPDVEKNRSGDERRSDTASWGHEPQVVRSNKRLTGWSKIRDVTANLTSVDSVDQ